MLTKLVREKRQYDWLDSAEHTHLPANPCAPFVALQSTVRVLAVRHHWHGSADHHHSAGGGRLFLRRPDVGGAANRSGIACMSETQNVTCSTARLQADEVDGDGGL